MDDCGIPCVDLIMYMWYPAGDVTGKRQTNASKMRMLTILQRYDDTVADKVEE